MAVRLEHGLSGSCRQGRVLATWRVVGVAPHEARLAVLSTDGQSRELGGVVPGGPGELVIGAVAHRAYRDLPDERLAALVAPGGTLADLKGMWRGRTLDPGLDRWTL